MPPKLKPDQLEENIMRGANTGSNGPSKPITPDTENIVSRWKLA